jgi:nicotinamide phosphoribosyltransferase
MTSDVHWKDIIGFMLHDFGARGVSSLESANIGGAAHLVHFLGTDTLSCLDYIEAYYDEDDAGYSINASEHSTVTCWGGEPGEILAFENMLDQFAKPDKILACVSDSYDIMKAVDKWYTLREKLINSGAKLVVRPDSGTPWEIVPELTRRLMNKFGFSTNSKRYDVLPPYLGVIQGDGINTPSIMEIAEATRRARMSAENFNFGEGGAMLQHVNRDTMKFAMKASAIRCSGVWHDVYKDPVTDTGKRSKRGRLALVKRDGVFQTIRREELRPNEENWLKPVFLNGKVLSRPKFSEIRERAAQDV